MNGENKYNMVFLRPSLSQAIPDRQHDIIEPNCILVFIFLERKK